ncbi:MAG: sulfatase [Acidobacteriota bacterium]
MSGHGRRRAAGALALAGLLAIGCPQKRPAKPPDVLLVVIDTLRADTVGAYGAADPITPHLDALSRKSRLYETAIAPSPWTKPSIASLLTGLTPREHGARRGLQRDAGTPKTDRLDATLPSLPSALRSKGYATFALQSNPHLLASLGFDQGFDEYRERPFLSADAVALEAIPILRDRPRHPLFLYVHILDPHSPYKATLAPGGLTREVTLEALKASPVDRTLLPRAQAAYRGEVFACDRAVGRMLRAVFAPTKVIVLADHGEEFLEHGAFEHGHSLHEELLRVPMLVKDSLPTGALVAAATPLTHVSEELMGEAHRSRPVTSEAILDGPDRIAIRYGRYKLVADLPCGTALELDDLEADPRETQPIPPGDPRAAPLAAGLAAFLRQYPAHPSTTGAMGPENAEQLKSLGYVEGSQPAVPCPGK